jgi:hypothetical protein
LEQLSALLHGFLRAGEWSEWSDRQQPSWYGEGERRARGRLALTVALAALPVDHDAFYSVDDLDQALFDRIGEHFSLGYLAPTRPYLYNKSPEEVRRIEQEWRAKLRAEWLARERQWLGRALSTWLYYLGLVELGMEGRTPVSVRLTALGHALLLPERQPEQAGTLDAPAQEAQAAWIVQPNFDVLVYLDRTTPAQLAFLERHAERVSVHSHTAQYKLTRESVYRGLESGTSVESLVSELQAGAGVAVPQNVLHEIGEWSALRERITLRRRARLVEFPDADARQAALQDGLKGIPVGERFALLTSRASLRQPIVARVDYAQPLPRCLSVSEDGVIAVTKPSGDLLLQAQLDQWAERMPDGTWRLTAASVSAAVRAGAPTGAVLTLLQERLTHALPPLLGVALQAWAGNRPYVELATVTVLRCPQPSVFDAIKGSELLGPYLRGALGPDVLLVDAQAVEALRAQLGWAGMVVGDKLPIALPRPDVGHST